MVQTDACVAAYAPYCFIAIMLLLLLPCSACYCSVGRNRAVARPCLVQQLPRERPLQHPVSAFAQPDAAAAAAFSQAPIELLLGPAWSNSCQLGGPTAAPRCSLPHLLGFCKLLTWNFTHNPTAAAAAAAGGGSFISYSYSFAYGPFAGFSCGNVLGTSGVLADLILWILLRLQFKLFRSKVYADVVACVAAESKAAAGQLLQQRRSWHDRQAHTALATSRLRTARTLRISKLKASMLEDVAGQTNVDYRCSSSSYATPLPAGSEQHQQGKDALCADLLLQQQHRSQAAAAAAAAETHGGSSSSSKAPHAADDDATRLPPLPAASTFTGSSTVHQQPTVASRQQQPSAAADGAAAAAATADVAASSSRHARSASDPHMGLHWPCQLDMQQQQQQQQQRRRRRLLSSDGRRASALFSSSSSSWEAGLCYVLFVAGFAIDYSLASLVYLVSMLLLPLLAPGRARLYWVVMLVYTEVGFRVLWFQV
jgi:hypothetical protein